MQKRPSLSIKYQVYNVSASDRSVRGMVMDNEVAGQGNSYTTEFRQYDPRLGRWKSLDPLMMKFPWMSPYVAFDNNPIFFVDPYGLEATNDGGEGDPWETGNERSDPGCMGDRGSCTVPDVGNNQQDYKKNDHDWKQRERHAFQEKESNITRALKRTNLGGIRTLHSIMMTKPHSTDQGYINKSRANLNSFYPTYKYETPYSNELNLDETIPIPENSISKSTISNTFVIREKYVYHKQVIETTFHFFDYESGKYLNSQIKTTIIEEKQYFDEKRSTKEDFVLHPFEFYSKVTSSYGPKIKTNVHLNHEMIVLIQQVLEQYARFQQISDMIESNYEFFEDGYEATKNLESDEFTGQNGWPVFKWKRR